jgi:hypothetical protein
VSCSHEHLPSASFRRLVWSNLAAQSGEQIALAAAPILAVLAFGAGAGETVCSRRPSRCHSCWAPSRPPRCCAPCASSSCSRSYKCKP